ncbi:MULTISPECIES: Sir2 family NAD-dependent protein deacetylase [unclassified Crossiella]|uniref:SIR2 family NAD-dependent protein deacylase n=1 Tax=unclassified Crossiella TaxID=2620835 RepID=UPI00200030A8|nr:MULTISPECIES: Sir2 family NAD-dependent protein deacetylase [unclassified Crossiella]MCK2237793.1 NAD-dependent protein deacetylase [Crossiella sp. S99.2]MCK2255079.1 NAD-dependent protein deacetylase [Crossiella sp. S99.1]
MPDLASRTDLTRAADLLRGADALLVCAGAGMGVDSGLPDFRGDAGFWRAYPPYAALGLRFEELADPVHFAEDPALAWGFYGHRIALYRATGPHAGFALLRKWGERLPRGQWVFTSNVDGQFQLAGFDRVAECHGSIHWLQCAGGCSDDIWPAADLQVEVDPETMRAVGELPGCPGCGGLARPNILMFGDYDWVGRRSQVQLEDYTRWRRELRGANLVVVEIGAGQAVPTVRRQAELASAAGGGLIRINPREPQLRHGRGIALPLTCLDALQQLDELV